MNIDEMTIGQAKQLAALLGVTTAATGGPFEIGKAYFFRTVTHHDLGRVIAVYPTEIVIEDASWIADDGRFSTALETGNLNEIEPFPAGPVVIGRGAIIDAALWPHALPRKVK